MDGQHTHDDATYTDAKRALNYLRDELVRESGRTFDEVPRWIAAFCAIERAVDRVGVFPVGDRGDS